MPVGTAACSCKYGPMAWRELWFVVMLAVGGWGCGRTEFVLAGATTDIGTETSADPTEGSSFTRGTSDSGGVDSGPPDFTTGLETGGPATTIGTFTTATVTTGFDTEIDETGFPGTTTIGPSTTTFTTTNTTNGTTDVGTTDPGTTDPGTTSVTTDPGTTSGTTDPGSTSGVTTDGGSTGTGVTGTDGDPSCLDAVDCVIACGGPSPGCINMCDNGLSPGDAAAFAALETCIIVQCILDGSCGPGGFGSPACVACRLGGQIDPSTVGCEAQAMNCN